MSFKKIGENLNFTQDDLLTPEEALANEDITKRFIKLAKSIKKVAPKAKDFLYGHAIMMHAAEASLIDQKTGEPLTNSKGELVKGAFEEVQVNGKPSVKWVSADEIMPYKNANGDIFPEAELLKAYKNWVGKPLCKDHKSDSVDGIRGIIIDTYYDPKYKRVHALFALDRINYADLARKVETGYANSVSMGTGVGRSVCTDCGNVAQTERDYCKHVRARSNYGEINLDLSPIELSLVVNGADGLAKVRQIVASMNSYIEKKQQRIAELKSTSCVNPTELQTLSDSLNDMQKKVAALMGTEVVKKAEMDEGQYLAALNRLQEEDDPETRRMLEQLIEEYEAKHLPEQEEPTAERATVGGGSEYTTPEWVGSATEMGMNPAQRLANDRGKIRTEGGTQGAMTDELSLLRSKLDDMNLMLKDIKSMYMEDNHMNSARLKARAKARKEAYWQGGGGVNEPTPGKPKYEKEDSDSIRDKEDKQMVGEPLETGSEGLHPGDEEVKKKYLRAEEIQDRRMKRQALLESLASDEQSEEATGDDLEARKLNRRAYWQGGGGVNEPTPGKPKYEKEDSDSIRDKEDKQMVGQPLETGSDGLHPGDEPVKKKWLRARLRAKFTKVADDQGGVIQDASKWDVFAGDKLVLTATGSEIFGDELSENWDYLSSSEYGKALIKYIRTEGFDRTAWLLKGAQDPLAPAPEAAPAGELDLGAPEPAPAPVAEEAPGGSVEVKQEQSETQEKVEAALNDMEEKIAEVRELVAGMDSEELVDIDVNVDSDGGDKPEAAAPASPMEGALATRDELLKVESLLDLSADELAEVSETLTNLDAVAEEKHDAILKAASAALEDSETILAEANKLVESAKKKSDSKKKGDKEDEEKSEASALLEEALAVRKQNRLDLVARAMGGMMGEDDMMALDPADEEKLKNLLVQEEAEGHDLSADDSMYADDKDEEDEEGDDAEEKDGDDKDKDKEKGKGKDKDKGDDEDDAADGVVESTQSVMAARKAQREDLLKQAGDILGKYELDLGPATNATEPTFFDAHPGGKGTVTELSHTKTPEAKVETLSEVHDVMRDVAESGPRNVREAAAMIQEEIVKGAMTASDLDQLVAEGKVDPAAAAYWKKYFGQAPDAGSFGADLSKEFASAKKEADDKGYKLKLRRAYDIAIEAQDKALIGQSKEALDSYVDELMTFDDAAFESTKRVVAGYRPAGRTAGSVPNVGLDANAQPMEVTASAEPAAPSVDLGAALSGLGWSGGGR